MTKEQRIAQKVAEIAQSANDFPGVVIVHNVEEPFSKTLYMSQRGMNILGVTQQELIEMGEKYHERFFNPEDVKDYLPKIYDMMLKNDMDLICSYFQQVRKSPEHPWEWYISSSKILMRNDEGLPLLAITFAVPIDPLHNVTNKVSRLLEENNFLRLHFEKFASLTKREKEVMKQLAKGLSSADIAKGNHITVETVKSHRKNIYQKLNIKSSFDLMEYARAFDLI